MSATESPAAERVRWAIGPCFAAAAFLALLSSCGSAGGAGEGVESDQSEIAGTRQATRKSTATSPPDWDGIYQEFGGGTRSLLNPFGLSGLQWQSADVNRRVLRSIRARGVAMQQATSKPVRIVFHMPAGWFLADRDGMRGALPTVPVMNGRKRGGSQLYPWRWGVWSEELTAIANAHPDWVLAVYFSGQMPIAEAQDAVDANQAYEIYDDANPRHRALVMGLVQQWQGVGVDEFILDNASGAQFSGGVPALAEAVRAEGGRLFVEAHPRDVDSNLRLELLQQIDGSLALHRNMVQNEPASLDWVVPDGVVMMVALTNHPLAGRFWRSTPTWRDVNGYRARGFTILSGPSSFDRFITEAGR